MDVPVASANMVEKGRSLVGQAVVLQEHRPLRPANDYVGQLPDKGMQSCAHVASKTLDFRPTSQNDESNLLA